VKRTLNGFVVVRYVELKYKTFPRDELKIFICFFHLFRRCQMAKQSVYEEGWLLGCDDK